MLGIEDGQEDQTERTDHGEEDGEEGAGLIHPTLVRNQLTGVSQPPFREEGQIQEDDGNDTSGDEEGLDALGTDVGDIPVAALVLGSGVSSGRTYAIVWYWFILE